MQQHLVVWGDIGTDRKALIAIKMDTESNQVIYRAFPEEDVTKDLQDNLFTIWKNGGDFQFPDDVPTWSVDADLDNILPPEIRLHKPSLLVVAQRHWNKKVMFESTFKLMSDKLNALELEMDSLQKYEQSLWDRTRALWEEILEYRKKDELSWQNSDELKTHIDLIFDALKAFKRLSQEKNYDESLALFKLFSKRADDCLARLIYPDEWNSIAQTMRDLQRELREAPLIMKHRRGVERKINIVFNDLRKYHKSDQINHLQDRIKGLNRVLHALKGAIDREGESYKNQFEKLKHYTRGKMSDDEIREQLGTVKGRTSENEKKIRSITKTIKSLESKIEQLKKPEPPRHKKQRSKPAKNKEAKDTEAENAESQKDPASAEAPVKEALKKRKTRPRREKAAPAAEGSAEPATESPAKAEPVEQTAMLNQEVAVEQTTAPGTPQETIPPAEAVATTEAPVELPTEPVEVLAAEQEPAVELPEEPLAKEDVLEKIETGGPAAESSVPEEPKVVEPITEALTQVEEAPAVEDIPGETAPIEPEPESNEVIAEAAEPADDSSPEATDEDPGEDKEKEA